MTNPNADVKFQAGQVWQYHTRPHEESSRLLILAVDTFGGASDIIHIRVSGLKLTDRHGNQYEELAHVPFSLKALERSVVLLEDTQETIPDFREGYETWRRAFDSGEGGVYSNDVSEAISLIGDSMS